LTRRSNIINKIESKLKTLKEFNIISDENKRTWKFSGQTKLARKIIQHLRISKAFEFDLHIFCYENKIINKIQMMIKEMIVTLHHISIQSMSNKIE